MAYTFKLGFVNPRGLTEQFFTFNGSTDNIVFICLLYKLLVASYLFILFRGNSILMTINAKL